MAYRFLENEAVADVAFIASGKTMEGAFESAAAAVTETMVRNIEGIRPETTRKFRIKAKTPEILLLKFLEKLIFLKDRNRLVFWRIKTVITNKKGVWSLECKADGEEINTERHEFGVDVKAVTMHGLSIKHTGGKWTCKVVLDI